MKLVLFTKIVEGFQIKLRGKTVQSNLSISHPENSFCKCNSYIVKAKANNIIQLSVV